MEKKEKIVGAEGGGGMEQERQEEVQSVAKVDMEPRVGGEGHECIAQDNDTGTDGDGAAGGEVKTIIPDRSGYLPRAGYMLKRKRGDEDGDTPQNSGDDDEEVGDDKTGRAPAPGTSKKKACDKRLTPPLPHTGKKRSFREIEKFADDTKVHVTIEDIRPGLRAAFLNCVQVMKTNEWSASQVMTYPGMQEFECRQLVLIASCDCKLHAFGVQRKDHTMENYLILYKRTTCGGDGECSGVGGGQQN